ncbi:MAG: phosphatase PAP2 family protein [Alphaproteobacteria bacterium]
MRLIENLRAGGLALIGPPAPRDGAVTSRALPPWPGWRRAAAAVLLVAIITLLAMIWLDPWWHSIAPTLSPLADRTWHVITDLGLSGWILVPSGVALLVIALFWRCDAPVKAKGLCAMLVARLGYVFLSVALPGTAVDIGKRLIGRARPKVWGTNEWVFHAFGWNAKYASLPSGHSTTAFAAAVAISVIWPRLRVVMWPLAALIAASRVVLNEHRPSDVIAGALVGVLSALLIRTWFARQDLVFRMDATGMVRAEPCPPVGQVLGAFRACFKL